MHMLQRTTQLKRTRRADITFEELFTTDPQETMVHVTGWGVLGARRIPAPAPSHAGH